MKFAVFKLFLISICLCNASTSLASDLDAQAKNTPRYFARPVFSAGCFVTGFNDLGQIVGVCSNNIPSYSATLYESGPNATNITPIPNIDGRRFRHGLRVGSSLTNDGRYYLTSRPSPIEPGVDCFKTIGTTECTAEFPIGAMAAINQSGIIASVAPINYDGTNHDKFQYTDTKTLSTHLLDFSGAGPYSLASIVGLTDDNRIVGGYITYPGGQQYLITTDEGANSIQVIPHLPGFENLKIYGVSGNGWLTGIAWNSDNFYRTGIVRWKIDTQDYKSFPSEKWNSFYTIKVNNKGFIAGVGRLQNSDEFFTAFAVTKSGAITKLSSLVKNMPKGVQITDVIHLNNNGQMIVGGCKKSKNSPICADDQYLQYLLCLNEGCSPN